MAENPDNQMTGAEIVLRALKDNGVKHVFGYPGGAVLPIYDEIFQQDDIQHILVRHEHIAEQRTAQRGDVCRADPRQGGHAERGPSRHDAH